MRPLLLFLWMSLPVPLAGPGAAHEARELGAMPLSVLLSVTWTDRADDGGGGLRAQYVALGWIDHQDEDAILGGFELACHGALHVAEDTLISDEARCVATDHAGNRFLLTIAAHRGPWRLHDAEVTATGGGSYARVAGRDASASSCSRRHGRPGRRR